MSSDITPGAKLATLGLLILTLIVGGSNLLATFEVSTATEHKIEHSAAVANAARQRQGVMLEHKLCITFSRLAVLQPPSGGSSDLSRSYLKKQHDILGSVTKDINCPASLPRS